MAKPLSYVGAAPLGPTGVMAYAHSASAMSKDILGADAIAAVNAAVAGRAASAAYFRSQLPSYVTASELSSDLASYFSHTEGGQPNGFATSINSGGTVRPENSRKVPANRWWGPYWPDQIPYNSNPVLATQPSGALNWYKLCEFTVPPIVGTPAGTGNRESALLVFGRFEGYASDSLKKGRPEVIVKADNKVIAWGAAPNGNGTGQMWPIVVLPAVDALAGNPAAGTTTATTVTAWLSTSIDNTSVGMGGMSQLVAYRVPLGVTN